MASLFNRRLLRTGLALAACGVTLPSLWVLLLYPKCWEDDHGYNRLLAAILASVLHWSFVLPLAVASAAGIISQWLPWLLVSAPIVHWAGSVIDGPVCVPFFLAPSLLILFAGYFELRTGEPAGRSRLRRDFESR